MVTVAAGDVVTLELAGRSAGIGVAHYRSRLVQAVQGDDGRTEADVSAIVEEGADQVADQPLLGVATVGCPSAV